MSTFFLIKAQVFEFGKKNFAIGFLIKKIKFHSWVSDTFIFGKSFFKKKKKEKWEGNPNEVEYYWFCRIFSQRKRLPFDLRNFHLLFKICDFNLVRYLRLFISPTM